MKLRSLLCGSSLALLASCSTKVDIQADAGADAGSDPMVRPVPSLTDADRTPDADCKDSWVAAATGRIVDNTGKAIEGASVGYCIYAGESGICLPDVTTNKGGWYSYPFQSKFRCIKSAAVRAYAPAETNLRLSEAYCKPPLTPKNAVLDLEADQILYTLTAPTNLPPLGDAKQSRVVTFPGDIEVTLTPDSMVEGDQYARISAGTIDPKSSPCFLPKDLTVDGLVAFGPNFNVNVFADKVQKVDFKFPAFGLSEGTAVDLYILGGLATQLDMDHFIDEGVFVKFGTGKVTGGRVVPDTGSQLPALTVIGIKKR